MEEIKKEFIDKFCIISDDETHLEPIYLFAPQDLLFWFEQKLKEQREICAEKYKEGCWLTPEGKMADPFEIQTYNDILEAELKRKGTK